MNTLRLLALALLAPPLAAQAVVHESASVSHSSGDSYYGFGRAVRLDGDVLLVGADGFVGGATGDVHVFRLGPDPVLEAVLAPADLGAFDRFGWNVALEGDRAVVGASLHDALGSSSGAAYVFRFDGAAWVQEQKLLSPSPQAGGRFGEALALQGDVLFVGEPDADLPGGVEQGRVHLFERIGGVWTATWTTTASDVESYESFGGSLALDGDRLAVKSAERTGAFITGAVYLFHRVGGVWTEVQKLTPASTGQTFGPIALDGDLLVVGDPSDDQGKGALHVFRETPSGWIEEVVVQALHPVRSVLFGYDVALEGERILASAPWESSWGLHTGAAHLFELEGTTWRETLRLVPSDGGFVGAGTSLDLSGGRAALGAVASGTSGTSGDALVHPLPPRVGVAACAGDGSGTPCPCGNESPAGLGLGCENGHGLGASLDAAGSASVGAGDLLVSASFTALRPTVIPPQPVLLFAGTSSVNGGAGVPFGDGLRCVGGSVVRLDTRVGTPYFGLAVWDAGLPGALGVAAGETRFFQAWYRDPLGTPCGSGFNTSNAVEVTFTP